MAAKLRPRVMLPRPVSTSAAAWLKPAADSLSGLLGSELSAPQGLERNRGAAVVLIASGGAYKKLELE